VTIPAAFAHHCPCEARTARTISLRTCEADPSRPSALGMTQSLEAAHEPPPCHSEPRRRRGIPQQERSFLRTCEGDPSRSSALGMTRSFEQCIRRVTTPAAVAHPVIPSREDGEESLRKNDLFFAHAKGMTRSFEQCIDRDDTDLVHAACHSEPRRRRGIPAQERSLFAHANGIPRALRRSG